MVGGDRRIPSYSGDYRYARADKDVEVQLLLFSTVRRVREGGLRETRPGQASCGDPSCAAYARSAQMKKPLSRSTFSDPVISTDDSEDWNEEDGESSADPGTWQKADEAILQQRKMRKAKMPTASGASLLGGAAGRSLQLANPFAAPAPTGFGAGGAPAVPAASASAMPSLFGGTHAASPFGAAAPATPAFGAVPAPSAFGAAAPAGPYNGEPFAWLAAATPAAAPADGSFGAAPAPAPAGAATPAAGAAAQFSFAAPPAAAGGAAPVPVGGLFDATPAPTSCSASPAAEAAATFSFGAGDAVAASAPAPAPAPAPAQAGGFTFGTLPPRSQSSPPERAPFCSAAFPSAAPRSPARAPGSRMTREELARIKAEAPGRQSRRQSRRQSHLRASMAQAWRKHLRAGRRGGHRWRRRAGRHSGLEPCYSGASAGSSTSCRCAVRSRPMRRAPRAAEHCSGRPTARGGAAARRRQPQVRARARSPLGA